MLTQLDEEGARSPVSQPLLIPHPTSLSNTDPAQPPACVTPTRGCFRREPPTRPSLAAVHPISPCLGHSHSVLSSRSSQKPSQNPSVCTLSQTSYCVGPRPPAMGTQASHHGGPRPHAVGKQSPPASGPDSIKRTLSSLPTSAPPRGLTFLWATDSFPLHLNSLPSPRRLFSAATPLPTSPACIHIRSEHLAHLLLGLLIPRYCLQVEADHHPAPPAPGSPRADTKTREPPPLQLPPRISNVQHWAWG